MKDGTPLLLANQSPTVRRALDAGYSFHYVHEPEISVCPLTVKARRGGDIVASATFTVDLTGLVADHGHCQNVSVQPQHKRRGVATAMYVLAEIVLGVPLVNAWGGVNQQPEAVALWAQPDRPFGRVVA